MKKLSNGGESIPYYKIIWIVREFWLEYKCVFIVLWSTKWREQCSLTVSELWEFTVRASYIVFLFVKNDNNNFIKEIKHIVRASIACWNPRQSLWDLQFSSRWKPSTVSRQSLWDLQFSSRWKPSTVSRQSLWDLQFSSRWKPSTVSRVFTDLLSHSPKRSPRFSPVYEGTEKNMFYFLNESHTWEVRYAKKGDR